MIPVLVLTHGDLATELLAAAREIDADLEQSTRALALPWDIDSDEASRQLKKALRELDEGQGVIVLTDMFGGTATNLALPQMKAGRVEIVTGVNLPMLVKLTSLRRQGLEPRDFALRLRDAGQKSIRVASEFLRR
ncbi:MAG: PTS sugar transporter subunit IIA [Thermoanaerobaculales bacterium]|nr:PTS sugar transporter subunit IIA [Thermoanaerobaculales bacterium]